MKDINNLNRLKKGEPKTFRLFFEFYYPKLVAFARKYVDESTAKDITQDAFIKFWDKKNILVQDQFIYFLFSCVKNDCLNNIKHQRVKQDYENKIKIIQERENYLAEQVDLNNTLTMVMTNNIKEIVEVAVEQLPAKCASIFRLYYFEDKTHKQIAEKLQISPRTVESHIRHAIVFLRKELKGHYFSHKK